MELLINGKKVQLHFGVRFVRELDKVAGISANVQGQRVGLGYGMIKSMPALQAYDTAVLSTVIYAAAYDANPRPALNDIDDYLDSCTIKQLEDLFSRINKAISESNAVQVSVKNMKA